MKNKIEVICYGKSRFYEKRTDAIRFFKECADCSEGSERERYLNILMDLYEGKTKCTDGVGD